RGATVPSTSSAPGCPPGRRIELDAPAAWRSRPTRSLPVAPSLRLRSLVAVAPLLLP
ncbi:hypothetical protein KI387_041182, partial [Taxus chinensis]